MRSLVFVLLLLTACSSRNYIQKEIRKTENQLHDHIGFYLTDLSGQKILVDHNGSKYFTPASTTKIFTLYTSLRLLSDSIVSLKYFQTGDSLIFQGMGDPSFLYKNVFDNGRVYNFLKNHPSKLFFSNANFHSEALGSGWAWDDYNDYYSAERSAFPIFGNLISVQKKNDSIFQFHPSHFASDFHVAAQQHPREEIIRGIDSNDLTYFKGEKKSSGFVIPFRTSADLFVDLLSDTLHRVVEEVTSDMKRASFLKSIPADSLYQKMMQESDNFIAEQLLLQCAAVVSDSLNPEIAIRYSKKNLLSDLPDPIQWTDGSGLSRLNLFTPRSITTLWKKIYETIPKERLFKLLAVGGKTGTLKNSYRAEQPYLFGKTGSLSNNRTLSGFVMTRKNKILIFSLMNNNFIASGSEVRAQMEKLMKLIHDNF